MSHKGTSTFILQRASAALLIPFAIWFLWSLAAHAGADREAALAWIGAPLNRVLLGALVVIGAFHGRIGVGEIIEDYLGGPTRTVLKWTNNIIASATAIVALYALATL